MNPARKLPFRTPEAVPRQASEPTAMAVAQDHPDLFDLLFDPPWLGIPAGVTASGRALDPAGGFVEVFVSVSGGRVREAGFLTDSPPSPEAPAMALASLWCERARGLTLDEAALLEARHLLVRGLERLEESLEAAQSCVMAGRAALAGAARALERPGEAGRPALREAHAHRKAQAQGRFPGPSPRPGG